MYSAFCTFQPCQIPGRVNCLPIADCILLCVVLPLSPARIGSAVLLNLYSLPATILVAYAIVIGYSVAWFTNTAFYLGARWDWITRLYWLYDLVLGLVIITPLFLISFFRVRQPPGRICLPTRNAIQPTLMQDVLRLRNHCACSPVL